MMLTAKDPAWRPASAADVAAWAAVSGMTCAAGRLTVPVLARMLPGLSLSRYQTCRWQASRDRRLVSWRDRRLVSR